MQYPVVVDHVVFYMIHSQVSSLKKGIKSWIDFARVVGVGARGGSPGMTRDIDRHIAENAR